MGKGFFHFLQAVAMFITDSRLFCFDVRLSKVYGLHDS